MFSVKVTESLYMKSFVESISPWKKMKAAMVGTTRVATTVDRRNLVRKDQPCFIAAVGTRFAGKVRERFEVTPRLRSAY